MADRRDPLRLVRLSQVQSEQELPVCTHNEVCNKVDTYASPWVEKRCVCPGSQVCSASLEADDGFTILDKGTRQYKVRRLRDRQSCARARQHSSSRRRDEGDLGPLASRCQSSSSSSVPCRPQLCQAVKPLPTCRLFRDVSWTLFHNDNHTSQVVKCACPADTMAYITTIEKTETGQAYHFGCSPEIVGASSLLFLAFAFH